VAEINLFDDLMEGLEQAKRYHQGTGDAKTVSLQIPPVPELTKADVKRIRRKAGMSQSVFAEYLGVSVKSVEAWEGGHSYPSGPARRLMQLLDSGVPVPVLSRS